MSIETVVEVRNIWKAVKSIPPNATEIISLCKKWDIIDVRFWVNSYNEAVFTLINAELDEWYTGSVGNYLLFDTGDFEDQDIPDEITPEMYARFYFNVNKNISLHFTSEWAADLQKDFDRIYFEEYDGE